MTGRNIPKNIRNHRRYKQRLFQEGKIILKDGWIDNENTGETKSVGTGSYSQPVCDTENAGKYVAIRYISEEGKTGMATGYRYTPCTSWRRYARTELHTLYNAESERNAVS